MAAKDRHQYIMSGLLEGWDWFDNGLQNVLRENGFVPLNKSQSMMILYISAGVQRPIEIARKMRLSRQAIRHIEQQLVEMNLITSRADPDDKRSKILVFSTKTTAERLLAQKTILSLEALLTRRIGDANVAALRAVLNLDWGEAARGMDSIGGRREPTIAVGRPSRKRANGRKRVR